MKLREEAKMTKTKNWKRSSLSSALAACAAILFSIILLSYGCGQKGYEKPTSPAENSGTDNPDSSHPPGNMAENPEAAPGAANESNSGSNSNNDGSNDAFAAPSRSIARPRVIPGGRTLTVRLLETVSSRTASPGQHFDAELAAPVVVNGTTVLPKGTPLRGRVVSARSSGRLKNPAYLRLTLDSVRIPDGKWLPITTTSVWAQGKSHKKRNLTLIGGGSGLGAVIGAIAGGGKGAAIGAAAGAGAGTAGAYATGKKDVTFPAERRLSFATVREVLIG